MKRFSAQYVLTNSGPPLKRPVITTEDDGRIISVEDTGGNLNEQRSVEFYNGIIIPGFVNCHCHLELSHLKNRITESHGLLDFIENVRKERSVPSETILRAAEKEDNMMFKNGISLCADICNTSDTFPVKAGSKIKYHNFIEVFGIDPSGALKRINESEAIAGEASRAGLEYTVTPHSFYSVSAELFNILLEKMSHNKISSVHFMESAHEKDYLVNRTGPVPDSYIRWGLLKGEIHPVDYRKTIGMIPGKLILVHNTFIGIDDLDLLKTRGETYYCICINSNIFIENSKPPVMLLLKNGCDIVLGTDSLASNRKLDMMSELITLQLSFPELSITDLVRWATINGAVALDQEKEFGSIEKGKKPGLVLIENIDFGKMKFLPESIATRLI